MKKSFAVSLKFDVGQKAFCVFTNGHPNFVADVGASVGMLAVY
jgi:hypothetical protein